jgi:hypothetical protein
LYRWSDDAGRQSSERDKEKMRDEHKKPREMIKKTELKSTSGDADNDDDDGDEEEKGSGVVGGGGGGGVSISDWGSEHTLTYGEILFPTFVTCVLDRVKHHGGLGSSARVFTDIGCGTAKPVFAAALTHPFTKSRGVEVKKE